MAIEVGYGLIGMVSGDDSFLNRIREIRRQAALELNYRAFGSRYG